MVATQGVFAAEDKAFDIHYLINNFKEQHDAHCKKMGITIENEASIKQMRPNDKRAFPHLKIACGEKFYDALSGFFSARKITIHNSKKKNVFYLDKRELTDAIKNQKITYQHAHDFLFDLHQTIQQLERNQTQSSTVTPALTAAPGL